jgi:hypothetical protein
MFTCTPVNSKRLYENAETKDIDACSKYLNNILLLRNTLLKGNIFSAYSYAMGLTGCPGNYHTDYDTAVSEELKSRIYDVMKAIGEI